MIDKDWDDIPYVDGDCVRDELEWNNMISYIKHSAACDFTIYDDEDSSNQVFRFTQDGTNSQMFGGADSGDDLEILANDTEIYSRIKLFGGGDIWIDTANDVLLRENGVQMFKFSLSGNDSIMEGGVNTGDDLKLKANSIDARPFIFLHGNSGSLFDFAAGGSFELAQAGAVFMTLAQAGGAARLYAGLANNDVYLIPNGAGLVKWGTEQTNAGSDRGELIPMKTAVGVTVYLKTYDLV